MMDDGVGFTDETIFCKGGMGKGADGIKRLQEHRQAYAKVFMKGSE